MWRCSNQQLECTRYLFAWTIMGFRIDYILVHYFAKQIKSVVCPEPLLPRPAVLGLLPCKRFQARHLGKPSGSSLSVITVMLPSQEGLGEEAYNPWLRLLS